MLSVDSTIDSAQDMQCNSYNMLACFEALQQAAVHVQLPDKHVHSDKWLLTNDRECSFGLLWL